ncbi:MAG: hypothetical protein GY810_20285 [Aureispira sp.]|nr:hypothetical protein [Aureispira sp.]
MKPFLNISLFFGILIVLLPRIYAHGGLDERIAAKTKEIEADPTNQQLYFDRGYLHQQHEDWDNALADYIQAKNLGFRDKIIHFRQAEVYLELALFRSGLTCTKLYLNNDSLDIKIHKLRAKFFFQLMDYEQSIIAHCYVLKHTIDLRPENYIELGQVYLEKDSNLVDSALYIINKGLKQLGSQVFILQQEKLNYLLIKGNQAAISEQFDQLLAINNRKENWYYQKAVYLFEQKQYKEALEANQKAKAAFEQLKPHLQQTKAMMYLLANIHSLEQKLQD